MRIQQKAERRTWILAILAIIVLALGALACGQNEGPGTVEWGVLSKPKLAFGEGTRDYVTGRIKDRNDRAIKYAEVECKVLVNGVMLDIVKDKKTDLQPGEVWEFKAYVDVLSTYGTVESLCEYSGNY